MSTMEVLKNLKQNMEESAENCENYAEMGTRPEFYRGKAEAFRNMANELEWTMSSIAFNDEKKTSPAKLGAIVGKRLLGVRR